MLRNLIIASVAIVLGMAAGLGVRTALQDSGVTSAQIRSEIDPARAGVPDSVILELDAVYPDFGVEDLIIADGPPGVYFCRSAGDVVADESGQVTAVWPGSPIELVGKPVHVRAPSDGSQSDFAPADSSRRLEGSYDGPAHFDGDGNLVAGWAVCRTIR